MGIRIGINGSGRIGRSIVRAALKNPEIEVVAINDLTNPETIAHLITYDSVHGTLDIPISVQKDTITIDNKVVAITSVKEPLNIPWADHKVDIVVECTGRFTDRVNAKKHLEAGAKKVIVSAPGKNPDITIVMGVNDNQYDPNYHHIVSNASCTTNCLAPVLKVLMESFGFECGFMTTVHPYTVDQGLLDFSHNDLRRARAAAMSMIPTTTGAAEAITRIIPEIKGKFNGISIRVPTPNVSLIDLVITVKKTNVTKDEVNQVLKSASEGVLSGILGYTDLPLVSIDYNGCSLSSVVDAKYTDVLDGQMVKTLSWYDNESAYAHRMIDLAAMIGKTI